MSDENERLTFFAGGRRVVFYPNRKYKSKYYDAKKEAGK